MSKKVKKFKAKKSKLTSWFKSHRKPSRMGVYQIRFTGSFFTTRVPEFAHWDGSRWGWAHDTPREADRYQGEDRYGASQTKEWRGYTTRQE